LSNLEFFIKENHNCLPQDEILVYVIFMANHFSQEIKNGYSSASQKALDNYKFGLEKEVLIHKGILDKTVYENIVTVAKMNSEFNWATNFANNYKQYLLQEWQEETHKLALAEIAFAQEKFNAVFNLLGQIELSEIFQNVRAKCLILRSYFELNDFDNFFNYCDSFYRYIKRSKLSEDNKKAIQNFIRLLRKLASVTDKSEDITTAILKTKPLFFKEWLLNKV